MYRREIFQIDDKEVSARVTALEQINLSTGKQTRAARAMLGLRREDLATAAGLHPNAVKYWEARDVPPGQPPYAIDRIERALTMLGVIAFADPDPGVLLSTMNNFDSP